MQFIYLFHRKVKEQLIKQIIQFEKFMYFMYFI